jgi:hypothetical protein
VSAFHKERIVRTLVVAAFALVLPLASAVRAQQLIAATDDCSIDSRCLDTFLSQGKETRDFTRLTSQLRYMFESDASQVRDRGLGWLGRHRKEFSVAENNQFDALYIEIRPDDVTARSLRNVIAERNLSASPADHRATIYWQAVRTGSLDIGGADPLDRLSALTAAAADGLQEFEASISYYATELDRGRPVNPGVRRSQELLWLVKMRRGAVNRTDGQARHAEALAEMEPSKFAELMDKDGAFRETTGSLLEAACEGPTITQTCKSLGRLYLKQEELRKGQRPSARERVEGGVSVVEADYSGDPAWLANLRNRVATGLAARPEERTAPPYK